MLNFPPKILIQFNLLNFLAFQEIKHILISQDTNQPFNYNMLRLSIKKSIVIDQEIILILLNLLLFFLIDFLNDWNLMPLLIKLTIRLINPIIFIIITLWQFYIQQLSS